MDYNSYNKTCRVASCLTLPINRGFQGMKRGLNPPGIIPVYIQLSPQQLS